MDIAHILRGVNDKDTGVWNDLFAYYYPQLCSYVGRLLHDATEAEDCIQNVLLYVWDGDRRFQQIEDLTYFLYRVAYNQAMMRLRHKKCKERHHLQLLQREDELSDDLFADMVREELIRQLYVHIDELPDEQRKVIRLCVDGLSNQEIAEKLGITINTVKTHKSRSLKFLRGRMEKWGCVFWLVFSKYFSN